MTVRVGKVAHGGHCVARHDGQVIFVRHALPDEFVTVVVTEVGPRGRYVRADTLSVREPSPERVQPPCRHAGTCGGCDWQHANLSAQRRLKADVLEEQLRRLGGVDRDVVVEPLPDVGTGEGLGWRTRVAFAVDADGKAGFRRHRSHDVVAIDACPIAHPLINATSVTTSQWQDVHRIDVHASVSTGKTVVSTDRATMEPLNESAAGRTWRISSGGFWQVHPMAADTLLAAVLYQLAPAAGEHALDLYAGVGLFSGPLGEQLGVGGRVDLVESDASAADDAAVNLVDLPTVHIHHATVEQFLRHTPLRRCDIVVLDPPRAGAGRKVLERVVRMRPRAISYVACDPAALGRDVATLADLGFSLSDLRAFDLFPMTHHVEAVALFHPEG